MLAPLLEEQLMISKRLGQLADGSQAWLSHVKADGRIHGRVNPNGAVTGRATHSSPNVAQVPHNGAPYGKECRALFGVPKGWIQAGIDACGLELRCLSHFYIPMMGVSMLMKLSMGTFTQRTRKQRVLKRETRQRHLITWVSINPLKTVNILLNKTIPC